MAVYVYVGKTGFVMLNGERCFLPNGAKVSLDFDPKSSVFVKIEEPVCTTKEIAVVEKQEQKDTTVRDKMVRNDSEEKKPKRKEKKDEE